MPPRDDDFNIETKRVLAKRVGYRCSFPGCGALTTGPSDEDSAAVSETGMACHISAASKGSAARRYDSNIASEQRKSVENGIWCCYSHGKLIDTDEQRFSISMLHDWKNLAEQVTRVMHEKQCTYEEAVKHFGFRNLVTETITLVDGGQEAELIGELLLDCGVETSWGKTNMHACRDLLIELARNALDHGRAKEVKITIEDSKITISDDGNPFDPKVKLKDGKGGSWAALAMKALQGDHIIWVYYHEFGQNVSRFAILRQDTEMSQLTPCSVIVERQTLYKNNLEIKFNETCNDIYIVVPKFMVYSDVFGLKEALKAHDLSKKTVTVVSQHISDGVIEYIKDQIPGCRVIGLS